MRPACARALAVCGNEVPRDAFPHHPNPYCLASRKKDGESIETIDMFGGQAIHIEDINTELKNSALSDSPSSNLVAQLNKVGLHLLCQL